MNHHRLTGPQDFERDQWEHVMAVECDNCGAAWRLPISKDRADEIEAQECPA